MINMQYMSSHELSQLSPKVLKEYINAYNLPNKLALEKDDLVKIIFNTRPISNESESYYRQHRTRKAPINTSSAENSSRNANDGSLGGLDPAGLASSFSNRMQDLFTSTFSNPNPSQQQPQPGQQQQQQQQQQRANQQYYYRPPPSRQPQQQQQQRANQQHYYRPPHGNYNRPPPPRQPQPQQQQQQQTTNSCTPVRPTATATSNDNLITIHDMIRFHIDPASLSVRTLKSILKANFVEQSYVLEKSELVKLVQRLMNQYKSTSSSSDSAADDSSKTDDEQQVYKNENDLCKICFDAQQNCVFLDCGHMCTCMECAKKLIETKNECPICRESIIKLVHVFRT